MESFKYTFDIQALDLVIKGHLDLIAEEERRLVFVSAQFDKRREAYSIYQQEKTDKKALMIELEKELFQVDEKLTRSTEHISMAANEQQVKALEKEISELTPKKDKLEEDILQLIEDLETLEEKIIQDDTYFEGVNHTLQEIKLDIEKVSLEQNNKIDSLNTQIKGLLSELPKDISNDFSHSRKVNRFKDPVVTLKAQSCGKCRLQMSSVEADNIMKRGDYLVCKGCSRVIVSPKVI